MTAAIIPTGTGVRSAPRRIRLTEPPASAPRGSSAADCGRGNKKSRRRAPPGDSRPFEVRRECHHPRVESRRSLPAFIPRPFLARGPSTIRPSRRARRDGRVLANRTGCDVVTRKKPQKVLSVPENREAGVGASVLPSLADRSLPRRPRTRWPLDLCRKAKLTATRSVSMLGDNKEPPVAQQSSARGGDTLLYTTNEGCVAFRAMFGVYVWRRYFCHAAQHPRP
jgi:hypothetical protein